MGSAVGVRFRKTQQMRCVGCANFALVERKVLREDCVRWLSLRTDASDAPVALAPAPLAGGGMAAFGPLGAKPGLDEGAVPAPARVPVPVRSR